MGEWELAMTDELTSEQIRLIDDMERTFYQTLRGMEVLKRPGVTLTDAQKVAIAANVQANVQRERSQRITAAKHRARIVTRAKGSKRA